MRRLETQQPALYQEIDRLKVHNQRLRVALEAWMAWATDENSGMGGPLFDMALELTEAAGVKAEETEAREVE